MPIIVPCPRCATRLSAPDDAAGKMVKCPKPGCGAIAEVPALLPVEEVPVVEASLASTRKPMPRRAEDDDPPRPNPRHDDDDDRPRSHRRPRREDEDDLDFDQPRRRRGKSGPNAGVIVAVVLGGLVLLGGLGYGIYALVGGKKSSGDAARKAPPPSGWKQYSYEKDNFRAYFPQEPTADSAAGFAPFGALGFPGATVPESFTIYMPQKIDFNTPRPVVLTFVLRYTSPPTPAERQRMRDALLKNRNRGPREIKRDVRTVRWLGVDAEEVTSELARGRIACVGTTLYVAEIASSAGGRVTAEEENGFFDNFELLK